ncbi:ATP-dependent DNA helicase RecQ [Bacteroidia bacterium]|nr:ATP-dependent DNA helicase RecQ [Bacteroidia bacterium]GHU83162.1 ATP-dependent DNA helicase RecQ [Bacteroidia bacterium]GHV71542.1 ATP-dependent DNA helicase RecQ [Bacteroidia bacterium]
MNKFLDILKEYWGYDSFRSLQEDIIASVYEGKDTLGLMPTGGGKSLTFQVPTLLMEGLCLVVTPLIALMKDQVDNLKKLGIKAAYIHSGMNRGEIVITLENCIFGNYKFLYVSPERLTTELFLAKLPHLNVCLLAIDESHCISQWGYDFRPSYMRIVELRDHLPGIPVLALTATATPDVIDDIQDKLRFKEKNVFRKSFERKNIAYVIRETDDKLYEIAHILSKVPGTAIVYVRSRKRTKEIAVELQRQGISADFFHAGLTSDEKIKKQNAWKNNQCRVIVCTNAFGMGIDKPDVRLVIHFELPSSLEEYFQEAGRAGRDEEKAFAIALYTARDSATLKKRIPDEFPERDFIKDVYEKLAYFFQIAINTGIDTGHNFHLDKFCRAYGYNMTQVHSALKILDLSGYIEYIEETDKQSRLIFTIQRDELYKFSYFSPEVENLIQVLLRSYTGLFADYIHINETLLAQRTDMNALDVYENLKYLSNQHIIHYIPAQKVPTIYYNRNREDIKYLSIPQSVYEQRRDKLIHRIKHVIEYGSSQTQCRSKMLLAYFGEKEVADCGKCDVCLAKKSREIKSSTKNKIPDEILALLKNGETTIEKIIALVDYPEKHVIEAIRFLSDNERVEISDNKIRKN